MSEDRSRAVQEIVIVGGGSAGWMTAAALSSMLPAHAVQITLIESEQIGTVGVGEATIPDIINFNAMLGIPEAEFLRETHGTFKLGIQFVDWNRIGESYFHPFGPIGADMNGIDFHQYWLRHRLQQPGSKVEDFSLAAQAAKSGRFALPDPDPRSVMSQLRYAYHFDATAYAAYLRRYAEARGVNRREGTVIDVQQNGETGFLTAVDLEDEIRINGDLFIDCTGFRARLIGQALDVAFKDWSHWLVCDTAQTVASEQSGALLPYTISSAKAAGWQWRIPTRTRTGNGHIYSSQWMDDDTAIDSLLADLDGRPLNEPRKIRFRTGHRDRFWEKNCIAIGLSGGFLEPLESTSLFLIQEGISKLLALFPSAEMPTTVRNEYNRQLVKKFEQVRDFIILHYKATERDDSALWNYCRTMDIPDSLTERIQLFRDAGRIFRYDDELFAKTNWIAVLLGQNIWPQTIDPIVTTLESSGIARSLQSMAAAMSRAVVEMPTHQTFLQRYAWAA